MANCLFCGDWTCCGGSPSDGSSYTLPTVGTTRKVGVKIGDGVYMAGMYLHLKSATKTQLGGVIVGDGLNVDGDGVLTCAVTGGSADVEGALWQDVIDDTPCLKFRYGDYEYNFFGTGEFIGSDAPPLDTSQTGQTYILSQAVSTVDGGLWYELRDEKPTLKFRKGSWEFSYKYTNATYLGSQTYGLVSYVDCDDLPPQDAIVDSDMVTLTGSNIYVADSTYANLYQVGENVSAENPATPLFGRAFTAARGVTASIKLNYDSKILPITVDATTQAAYTIDCWIFFNDLAVTKATVTVYPTCSIGQAKNYSNRPHHLAITCEMIYGRVTSRLFFDGVFSVQQSVLERRLHAARTGSLLLRRWCRLETKFITLEELQRFKALLDQSRVSSTDDETVSREDIRDFVFGNSV